MLQDITGVHIQHSVVIMFRHFCMICRTHAHEPHLSSSSPVCLYRCNPIYTSSDVCASCINQQWCIVHVVECCHSVTTTRASAAAAARRHPTKATGRHRHTLRRVSRWKILCSSFTALLKRVRKL